MKKAIQVLAIGMLLLVLLPGLAWASPGKPPKARDQVRELCASPVWAKNVLDFEQGPRLDDLPVLEERSNPGQALGAPDDAFVSLGFKGSITVRFKRPILNNPGPDDLYILVQETTWFDQSWDYPLETAKVYLIVGSREVYAGEVHNRVGDDRTGLGIITIPAGIRHVHAVKLVDATNPSDFDDGVEANPQWEGWYNADAFDLDAVGTCASRAK